MKRTRKTRLAAAVPAAFLCVCSAAFGTSYAPIGPPLRGVDGAQAERVIEEVIEELRVWGSKTRAQFPESEFAARWTSALEETADQIECGNGELKHQNINPIDRFYMLRRNAAYLIRLKLLRGKRPLTPEEVGAWERISKVNVPPKIGALYYSRSIMHGNFPFSDFTTLLGKCVDKTLRFMESGNSSYAVPDSSLIRDLIAILDDIGQDLLALNAEMNRQNKTLKERIPILRRRYLIRMREIHQLESDGYTIIQYNERAPALKIYPVDKRHSLGDAPIRFLRNPERDYSLARLLEIREYVASDPFTRAQNRAFMELERGAEEDFGEILRLMYDSASKTRPPRSFWREYPDLFAMIDSIRTGLIGVFLDFDYQLTKLDAELADQNLPREERIAALREAFFAAAEQFKRYDPFVRFNASAVCVEFFDNRSNPIMHNGKPAKIEFPPELIALLDLSKGPAPQGGIPAGAVWTGAAVAVLLLIGGAYAVRFKRRAEI